MFFFNEVLLVNYGKVEFGSTIIINRLLNTYLLHGVYQEFAVH